MIKIQDLPKKIPVFPLSNFIIFPKTSVPLNIFEPRYIDMVNDSIKSNKIIGMIQPTKSDSNYESPSLHNIGCMGKIISFKESDNGRFLIELRGIIRYKIIKEVYSNKKYRECEISFDDYLDDIKNKKEELKFSDLELIFKDLKNLFEKRGFVINWEALKKQNLDETINALAMASPFTVEEKQVLLEAKNLETRKEKISQILKTYNFDEFNNTTIQ